jgi:hypothetical protein
MFILLIMVESYDAENLYVLIVKLVIVIISRESHVKKPKNFFSTFVDLPNYARALVSFS